MLGVLALIAFAALVSKYGKPLAFAAGFAALAGVRGLVNHGASVALLTSVAASFGYDAAYFFVVHRVSDSILLLMLVVFVGAALYVMIPIWLLAEQSAGAGSGWGFPAV